MSGVWFALCCVAFTGGFVGWHLKGWKDRRDARTTGN